MTIHPGTSAPSPAAASPAGEWVVPPQERSRPRMRRTGVWIAGAAAIAVAGLSGLVTRGGSSSDGAFSTGDCVVLTASTVRGASCGVRHDGRITGVLHQTYQTCAPGSEEFDVTDSTGNLCIDRTQ